MWAPPPFQIPNPYMLRLTGLQLRETTPSEGWQFFFRKQKIFARRQLTEGVVCAADRFVGAGKKCIFKFKPVRFMNLKHSIPSVAGDLGASKTDKTRNRGRRDAQRTELGRHLGCIGRMSTLAYNDSF